MTGEVEIVENVAPSFARLVAEAFASRPGERFSLVLSGGPTARACYEALAAHGDSIAWDLVDVFMGDERCVPADDPDANQRLVRESLLDRVGPVGSFRPMSCEEGPAGYQALLEQMPALDVVHLGMGPDGHTASLFPDAPTLHAPDDELVALARDPHERNAHDRMTLTYPAISRARLVVFTVAGAAKKAAFAAVRAGADLPAARVRAGRIVWLVDRDASG